MELSDLPLEVPNELCFNSIHLRALREYIVEQIALDYYTAGCPVQLTQTSQPAAL